MSDEVFLSMTRNERFEAARVMFTTTPRKKSQEKWWNIYNGLLGRLEAVDFKWEEISLTLEEQIWRDNTRPKREKGTLTHEQHKALKIIGFPFIAHLNKGGKKGKGIGEEFQVAASLLERSKDPKAEPLTQEEQEFLKQKLNTARSKYQGGQLSERMARILGIT